METTFLLLLMLAQSLTTLGFAPIIRTMGTTKSSTLALPMVPKFDPTQEKWVATSPEEGPEAGYDIWGSLLRQGPNPFFQRLFQAEDYNQGVLKFMAGDKVDRNTAQAEMDAYLQNPNDWAYNRLNGYNVDYLSLNAKKIETTTGIFYIEKQKRNNNHCIWYEQS
eukprot:scaffold1069_cov143-Cylindrotheca_fusiformis.AAC.4